MVDLAGYEIAEQIYAGSRTAVYRALRQSDRQRVVIKQLYNSYPTFSELLQFRNQYTIAKNLNIPGIVRPYSLESYGNSYVLVMEDCGGISLNRLPSQFKPLTIEDILSIGIQLADILHELHQNRVIHKDIKPANILINSENKQVKLIDFSIASLLPKETQEIKNPNILEGTLAYLAPEQTGRMNRGIDYRSDFYALGVTLFELLTGQLPFESNDPMELVHCHIAKQPPALVNRQQTTGNREEATGNRKEATGNRQQATGNREEIPSVLADIVMKLMAKNAEDRYQSALGLKHDLEICLQQLQETGKMEEFEIGQRDLCDRFLIPEKLYGRETEVQILLDAFDRVASGSSELMLVAGFSGIGKTAVVNEVHKPIVRQRGYFIKGKFDQFNRNIPLSAFVQALRDLMGQLLSESDTQLAGWQAKILTAVGENGQVLIEVIPELEQIIGPQPIAAELSGSAAQNRFNLLFQKFIEVFSTADHPLILFLDDLQWVDLASLQLLKLLMNDNGYLLLLGAYRDNEVSPVHPFIMTVDELQKAQTIVNTIVLKPLAFEDTNHLVADTLNCLPELAQPLTELVDRKTQGNPFFTTQFLKALHDDGYIRFDRDRRYWECNITQVNTLALTDDVVEFMAVQLQKLPAETQQVLKLAACIGNQFDLATLAIVSERSSIDTATTLWKALQEGLILPTSQIYKFFQGTESSDVQSNANPTYRFLHDRVQQAADSLIPEDQKQSTHLKIGQLLLQNLTSQEQDEKLFDIVNHFNSGKALLVNLSERNECVRLNLNAGQKAKTSTAYTAAFEYLTIGIKLQNSDCWQTQYDLALLLHTEAAEVAYLGGRFEELEAIAQTVLTCAKTFLDKIKIYETQIQAYLAQNKLDLAIKTGQSTLKSLEIHIPRQANMVKVLLGLAITKLTLAGKKIPDLLNLPTMQTPKDLAAMRILASTLSAAYIGEPKLLPILAFKQVNLSIKRGNTALSAFAYCWYGTILCGALMDIETGYQFGQLAIQVQEKLQAKEMRCKVIFMVNCFIRPWKEPLKETIAPLKSAYQSGLETGDLEYASWAALIRAAHLYGVGHPLTELESDLKGYVEAVSQFNQDNAVTYLSIYHQTVENWLGKSIDPNALTGDCYSEDTDLPRQIETGDRTGLAFSYINQLELCYRFGDLPKALKKADLAKQYEDACAGLLVTVTLYVYDSLTRLALYSGATPSEQHQLLKRVVANQKKMKTWAQFAPENHQHQYDLVEAERQHALDNKSEASELYDRAIAGAKANGYIQEEALANELAAKFYLNWGKEKIAQEYLTNAYYGYAHWGAKAKVQDLECHYPQLLAPILQQQQIALSATEAFFGTISLATSQASITQSSSSSNTSISASLDLATVLKASQTLSSEIELDKLLATLLHKVLENAGADKGALLMPRDNQWFVEAVATVDRPARVQSIALSNCSEVPQSLINTVKRNREPVTIVDASVHPTLAMDGYVVAQQPKSLLCTPILNQGKLVAILYLENHLTVGAFTCDRVKLLNFLCAQAAISLENARLYQQAQAYTQQLEQSQLQIVQSEKMASLGNLVAGVAHEINNPIGFLNGSINNTKDYVQDLLEHLALYQQHYPHPVAPIQENAADIDLEYTIEDLPNLVDAMQSATDRIKNISTSLRTFSRADTDCKVSANLHDGLDSTLLILKYRLKANDKRPAIEVIKNYGDLPEIECFPGQLNQVFMNIVANAIDMFEELTASFSFKYFEANPQQITIQTERVDSKAFIRICDNGKGMSEEVQTKIFDHLFTTKPVGKGTGLGLAIARQIIVEKHGGEIMVNSMLGKGTEFVLTLPISGKS
jgi:predicted ATPase/signal transduction histidine kinase